MSDADLLLSKDCLFECSRCTQVIIIDRSVAGTRINCPGCRASLSVPIRPSFLTDADSLLIDLVGRIQNRKLYDYEARIEFRDFIRAVGYNPYRDGVEYDEINDLSHLDRIKLVIETNTSFVYGYSEFGREMDSFDVHLYPAKELFFVHKANEDVDWKKHWMECGGKLFEDRMIAPLHSKVWQSISDFECRFPPYRVGSGTWIRDIAEDEAISLGVVKKAINQRGLPEARRPFLISIDDPRITRYMRFEREAMESESEEEDASE